MLRRALPIFTLWLGLFTFATPAYAAKGWSWWGGDSTEKAQKKPFVPSYFLTVAPAIIVAHGAAPGVNVQLSAKVLRDAPLFVTVDLGPFFETGYYGGVVFPILFGAEYQFDLPGTTVHPLIGVNLGPVVYRYTVFGMLIRPGLNIDLAHNLQFNIETRLGAMGSAFVFMPVFGLRFQI